jgi:hypothetical protein
MKKKQPSAFETFREELPPAAADRLQAYFSDLDRHCTLGKRQRMLLRGDFEQALLYYAGAGLPLEEALARLDVANLGSFYARPPILWYTLDDAAKIYPLSMKPGQMAVFRLAVNLKAPVIPPLLQMALNFTIKRFPSFATTVKKGFFWHYLDTAKRRFTVCEETDVPCQPLDISHSVSQTFRVLWYEKRISVEFFHILTDGTGGMAFLKALVAEYLRLTGVVCAEEGILDRNELPCLEETANEFSRAEHTPKSGGFVDAAATQMSGRLSRIKPCQILHFRMDAALLKQAAARRNATVTAYMLSHLFLAGRAATDELSGTINIQVPVNMRKFYPSRTVRNFALYCGIRLPITEITDEPALLENITSQLHQKASRASMDEMMNSTQHLIRALRYIPLALKTPVARVVYGFLGDQIFSNTLSNLGVVTMPEAYAACIESVDFVLGTAITNRASCSMVTFGNVATLTVAKQTTDPSFEEALYRLLREDGIDVEAEGSPLYDC